MREVVKVETQEQYDYVLHTLGFEFEAHINFSDCENFCISLDTHNYTSLEYCKLRGYKIISFNEFKSRYELKIGDTFEYNGFICEVKEEVNKWYKIEDNKNNKVAFEKLCKQDVLDILKLPYTKLTEITNKEFIKQLEENAR